MAKAFLVCLALSLIAVCQVVSAQNIQDGERPTIGLQYAAVVLLKEVESAYGKNLHLNVAEDMPDGAYGYSQTLEDGTPVITVNKRIGLNEANVVHELFHLKLQAEGFPLFRFEFSASISEETKTFISALNNLLYDPMTHRIFFPTMQAMGYDPNSHIRAEMERNMRSAEVPSDDELAVYYCRIAMEFGDAETMSKLNTWYQNKNWEIALEKGRGLYDIVQQIDPGTPVKIAEAYIRSLNYLLLGRARFSLIEIVEKSMGNTIKKYAMVKVRADNL